MELLGSAASPYARRTRLLLTDVDYDFRDLAIYDADKAELARHNPTLKVPTLIDGDLTLFDSRVIQRYLADRFGHAPLDWIEENQLTVIDGANDALVVLRLAQVSGLDIHQPVMIYERHRERIGNCLDWLETAAGKGAFDDWRYPAICLYCMIDWAEMRELFDFSAYRALLAVRERHRDRPGVATTDPR
ncbi:glutathione S-transferase family protein [Salinisphaera hydrothermalis]|uniref:glutathione S-transferase family protein n=1 Tax=Salinisphaera hydrothermalis TaxID=563188 RepID=UPI00333ED805